MERVTWKLTLPYANRQPMGICCMAQETQVQSLGQKDHLEKEMVIYCNILAWKIPWTEEPGGLQSQKELDMPQRLKHHHVLGTGLGALSNEIKKEQQ